MSKAAILELKTIDTEVKTSIQEHEDTLYNYIHHIRNKDHTKAKDYYDKLMQIDNRIKVKLARVQVLDSQIKYNNNDVTPFLNENSLDIKEKLRNDNMKVRELERNLNKIKGINAHAAIVTKSERTKYIFICILAVFVVIMTIRAFVYEPKAIDTLFLGSAIFLGVFHFFNKQV